AAVDTAEALLQAVAEHQPDLSIVDVRLPPTFRDEGIRAALRLRPSPVLILSQYVERTYAAELLAGGTAMDPEVVRQLFARNTNNQGVATLTPREREVLGLVAQGLSNSAISTALVLAPVSVEKHIGNIFAKLGLPPSDDSHRRVLAVL